MKTTILPALVAALWLAAPTPSLADGSMAELTRQVETVEAAFARTMAERDFDRFQTFLADEAVFLGNGGELRGKRAVAEHWRRFFDEAEPPFSWRPGTVAVLDSGGLAISTGPVFDSAGTRISTFTSVWRREPSGDWRIVFDKGDGYCE